MTKRAFLGTMLVLLALASGASAQTVNLFNTGVDATGTPMAGGAVDTHYTFTFDVVSAKVLNDQAPGPYVQSPTSRWVWVQADGLNSPFSVPPYDVITTFTLTPQEIASGVTLSGRYATDNTGTLLLNGNPLSSTFNSSTFTSWTPFSIDSGLIAGNNTLTFRVTNDSGTPGGLNVDQLQYTVGSGAAAPEPGTLALLALGGVSAGTFLRRRRA
jgi:hypothetical protein